MRIQQFPISFYYHPAGLVDVTVNSGCVLKSRKQRRREFYIRNKFFNKNFCPGSPPRGQENRPCNTNPCTYPCATPSPPIGAPTQNFICNTLANNTLVSQVSPAMLFGFFGPQVRGQLCLFFNSSKVILVSLTVYFLS